MVRVPLSLTFLSVPVSVCAWLVAPARTIAITARAITARRCIGASQSDPIDSRFVVPEPRLVLVVYRRASTSSNAPGAGAGVERGRAPDDHSAVRMPVTK